jgi:hypothetical protein
MLFCSLYISTSRQIKETFDVSLCEEMELVVG